MALQGFPEVLGRQQVAMRAEPEFDRVADTVDGAVETHPLTELHYVTRYGNPE